MNLNPGPVLKLTEPLLVLPLRDKWIQSGFEWKEMTLLWLGSESTRQNYQLVNSESVKIETYVIQFLSEDEKIIFRAFQDWFNGAIKKAAETSRGYFTFDVLQFGIADQPWSWPDFTALLISHAKKIVIEERRLIQFGSLWGVLHKRTEMDWGRVESKLNLDFCKPSTEACVRWIKKQIAKQPLQPQARIVFRDLSRSAICPETEKDEFLMQLTRLKAESQAEQILYWHVSSGRRLQV